MGAQGHRHAHRHRAPAARGRRQRRRDRPARRHPAPPRGRLGAAAARRRRAGVPRLRRGRRPRGLRAPRGELPRGRARRHPGERPSRTRGAGGERCRTMECMDAVSPGAGAARGRGPPRSAAPPRRLVPPPRLGGDRAASSSCSLVAGFVGRRRRSRGATSATASPSPASRLQGHRPTEAAGDARARGRRAAPGHGRAGRPARTRRSTLTLAQLGMQRRRARPPRAAAYARGPAPPAARRAACGCRAAGERWRPSCTSTRRRTRRASRPCAPQVDVPAARRAPQAHRRARHRRAGQGRPRGRRPRARARDPRQRWPPGGPSPARCPTGSSPPR